MTSSTFNTLFIAFFILGILMTVLAVVFFFVFDIRKIFSMKSGSAMRQSMRELDEINRSNDNKQRRKFKARSVELYKDYSKELAAAKEAAAQPRLEPIEPKETKETTEQLGDEDDGTALLENPEPPSKGDTMVLSMLGEDMQVTEELGEAKEESAASGTEEPEKPQRPVGKFEITETKMVVFAEERIVE